MATVDRTTEDGPTITHDRFMAAIEADIAGHGRYPSGTAFVSVETEGLGRVVARCARERRPIVLVYPDGEERLVTASRSPLDTLSALSSSVRLWFRGLH